jgi:hypothetical protein
MTIKDDVSASGQYYHKWLMALGKNKKSQSFFGKYGCIGPSKVNKCWCYTCKVGDISICSQTKKYWQMRDWFSKGNE